MSSQNHWGCQKELSNASADFLAANQKQWNHQCKSYKFKKIHSTMNTSIFLNASKIGLARWVGFIVHTLKTQLTKRIRYRVRDTPEEKLRENGISLCWTTWKAKDEGGS